uniref:PIPK domain-containing protein n=1 Tax=Globodera pallida TaxID=36090 RepID=A0A183CK50_GLOPA
MITNLLNTKKCLAVLQVERKDKLTAICLKYEFFMTETEQFFASGDEHCKPTVGHMTQTLLPKHLAMSMEQLTEKFDLQLQLLDIEFVPAEFIDIDPGEWCTELVKDRGRYKVLLQPKLDNNSANRIVEAGKVVPESVGGGRRLDDKVVTMKGQQTANREGERRCDDGPIQEQQNANKEGGRRLEVGPMRGQRSANREGGRRLEVGPMRGQRSANREGGRRLEDEGVPMGGQQNANNDWEPIDRFLLSGKGHLGNSDNFVTSNDLGFMRKKLNMRSPTEQRALKPYNDSMEEYIFVSIQDRERFVLKAIGKRSEANFQYFVNFQLQNLTKFSA